MNVGAELSLFLFLFWFYCLKHLMANYNWVLFIKTFLNLCNAHRTLILALFFSFALRHLQGQAILPNEWLMNLWSCDTLTPIASLTWCDSSAKSKCIVTDYIAGKYFIVMPLNHSHAIIDQNSVRRIDFITKSPNFSVLNTHTPRSTI